MPQHDLERIQLHCHAVTCLMTVKQTLLYAVASDSLVPDAPGTPAWPLIDPQTAHLVHPQRIAAVYPGLRLTCPHCWLALAVSVTDAKRAVTIVELSCPVQLAYLGLPASQIFAAGVPVCHDAHVAAGKLTSCTHWATPADAAQMLGLDPDPD